MKRLKMTYQGRVVVSDIFNFKAYRMISEALSYGAYDLDTVAMQGIIAMFDGTEIDPDVLIGDWSKLDLNEYNYALNKVMEWFNGIDVPKSPQPSEKSLYDSIIGVYNFLLSSHLPSEVDKQDPQLLIDVLYADTNEPVDPSDLTEDQKFRQGLK